MAQALLRPRSIVLDGEGGVAFVNDSAAPRISATQALRHPFVRTAVDPLAQALAREWRRQLLRSSVHSPWCGMSAAVSQRSPHHPLDLLVLHGLAPFAIGLR
jgi:hypothetical protein